MILLCNISFISKAKSPKLGLFVLIFVIVQRDFNLIFIYQVVCSGMPLFLFCLRGVANLDCKGWVRHWVSKCGGSCESQRGLCKVYNFRQKRWQKLWKVGVLTGREK